MTKVIERATQCAVAETASGPAVRGSAPARVRLEGTAIADTQTGSTWDILGQRPTGH